MAKEGLGSAHEPGVISPPRPHIRHGLGCLVACHPTLGGDYEGLPQATSMTRAGPLHDNPLHYFIHVASPSNRGVKVKGICIMSCGGLNMELQVQVGLVEGVGSPHILQIFAKGGRNQTFVPMEGEDASRREEDFFDVTEVDVQGGMGDVGDGNVDHGKNRGLWHKRPERWKVEDPQ